MSKPAYGYDSLQRSVLLRWQQMVVFLHCFGSNGGFDTSVSTYDWLDAVALCSNFFLLSVDSSIASNIAAETHVELLSASSNNQYT